MRVGRGASDNRCCEHGQANDPGRGGSGYEPRMELKGLAIFLESLNAIDTKDLAVRELFYRQPLELPDLEGVLWACIGQVLRRLECHDIQSKSN